MSDNTPVTTDDLRWSETYEECFGCGETHPYGLRMTFTNLGDGTVESRYTAHSTHAGAPGVIHGGLQATMLDEVGGYACHTLDPPGTETDVVTMEFSLRYRRPVPTGVEVRVVGHIVEVDGDDVVVEGRIELPDGTAATTSTARWRRLRSR